MAPLSLSAPREITRKEVTGMAKQGQGSKKGKSRQKSGSQRGR